MSPTVEDMLKAHLAEIGADGLCAVGVCDESCGCGIDDLTPCDCIDMRCVAAKKIGDRFYPLETKA